MVGYSNLMTVSLLNSRPLNVRTPIINLHPALRTDAKLIYELRLSDRGLALSPTSSIFEDQEAYLDAYNTRFLRGEEVYYVCSDVQQNFDFGVTRMTGLNLPGSFGWESLVVSKKTKPGLVIDLIFTIYKVGFEILGKDVCGPWAVPKSRTRIIELHRQMSIAHKVSDDGIFNFYEVTRSSFYARKSYFECRGYGAIS